MDVSAAALSMPALYAFMGQAMSGAGASAATTEAGGTPAALSMEAAALQSTADMAAQLLGGQATGPSPVALSVALAGLARLDPSGELARLASATSTG